MGKVPVPFTTFTIRQVPFVIETYKTTLDYYERD